MSWDDVRYFLAVMRSGSLSAAARALQVQHSTVARRIDALESSLRIRLFDRLPRGMQLTLAGEIVIAAVRRGQRDFDNALTQVEDLR
ncbi:LysR family transcriptional regulator, partial [Escherichia coli]|nr:LysR family transcriptional regulator [Escherichia coli]